MPGVGPRLPLAGSGLGRLKALFPVLTESGSSSRPSRRARRLLLSQTKPDCSQWTNLGQHRASFRETPVGLSSQFLFLLLKYTPALPQAAVIIKSCQTRRFALLSSVCCRRFYFRVGPLVSREQGTDEQSCGVGGSRGNK